MLIRNEIMKYCPKCGSAAFKQVDGKKFYCDACGFVFFMNNATAVAMFIADEQNRLLMVVRADDPAKGKLDLPGGFVDPGETVEHAGIREVKEELNLDVEQIEYLCTNPNSYFYKGVTYPVTDVAYVCKVGDFSEMKLSDEIADTVFLEPERINFDEFAFGSTVKNVKKFIDTQKK